MPRHKKYPPAGKKSQLRLNKIWLDQADALEVKEGEEVTLMDWGNMIIKVQSGVTQGGVVPLLMPFSPERCPLASSRKSTRTLPLAA